MPKKNKIGQEALNLIKSQYPVFKGAIFIVMLTCLFPRPADAYIGPGAGLSAIGAFLAVVLGIIIALFGFVWYPLKKILSKSKKRKEQVERQ